MQALFFFFFLRSTRCIKNNGGILIYKCFTLYAKSSRFLKKNIDFGEPEYINAYLLIIITFAVTIKYYSYQLSIITVAAADNYLEHVEVGHIQKRMGGTYSTTVLLPQKQASQLCQLKSLKG